MATLGDGTQWDETNPTQNTLANTIDAFDRDMRVGTRLRMSNEHVWPSSQTGTSQAGQHLFMTVQQQAVAPTFSAPQVGVFYADSSNNPAFTNGITNFGMIPKGGIIMWYGNIASIPTGWALCNGSNGTPDLRNRFVVAADADSAGTAMSTITGAALQTFDGSIPAHTHTYTAPATPVTGFDGSSTNAPRGNNFPGTVSGSFGTGTYTIARFFALAFIMKL